MGRKLFIIVTLLLAIQQYALGEDELDGDAKFLNFSSRGLKDTLDLSSFAQLTAVDFSHNDLTTITWQHFAAPRLREADLAGNGLLSFPELGPLENIPLQMLNMSDCNVKIIGDNALHGLDLEILDVRENPVQFKDTSAFDGLETPPRLLIVSKITEAELHHICKNVDMQVFIVDTSLTKECKDVRRSDEKIGHSPTREKLTKTQSKPKKDELQDVIVEEEMLTDDTHLEMLADGPVEGSGFEDEIIVPENATKEKQDSEIVKESLEKQTDDEMKDEKNEDSDVPMPEAPIQNTAKVDEIDPFSKEDTTADVSEEGTENKSVVAKDKADDKAKEDTVANEEAASEEDTVAKIDAVPNVDAIPTKDTMLNVDATPSKDTMPHKDAAASMKHVASNDKEPEIKAKIFEPNNTPQEQRETLAKNPLQRSGGASVQLVTDNKEEELQEIRESDDEGDAVIGENKTNTSSSFSKNVILIVIVGIVVVGSVFIAMKLYKDHRNYNAVLNEGREMALIHPYETISLMDHKSTDAEIANGNLTDDQLAEVVISPMEAEQEKDKTTKEILEDVENSGLPDIDDPNRLSTFIVSNTNIYPA